MLTWQGVHGRHPHRWILSSPLPALPAWRLQSLKRAVLADDALSASAGVDEGCFMAPEHLHLTLAMLKLYSDEARFRAK